LFTVHRGKAPSENPKVKNLSLFWGLIFQRTFNGDYFVTLEFCIAFKFIRYFFFIFLKKITNIFGQPIFIITFGLN